MDIKGSIVNDSNLICEHLNNHFSTIGQSFAKEITSCDTSPMQYLTNVYPDFNPSNTTPEEITSIVKSLKISAPEVDEIHIKVIKISIRILAPIISNLINLSFRKGEFPEGQSGRSYSYF